MMSKAQDLRECGSGIPASPDLLALYNQAFEQFGTAALWSCRHIPNPTVADVLVISGYLRRNGTMKCRELIGLIEATAARQTGDVAI